MDNLASMHACTHGTTAEAWHANLLLPVGFGKTYKCAIEYTRRRPASANARFMAHKHACALGNPRTHRVSRVIISTPIKSDCKLCCRTYICAGCRSMAMGQIVFVRASCIHVSINIILLSLLRTAGRFGNVDI